MERVERIKHLNVRGFWAQGIVSADATIRMSTASCPAGGLSPDHTRWIYATLPASSCR